MTSDDETFHSSQGGSKCHFSHRSSGFHGSLADPFLGGKHQLDRPDLLYPRSRV